MHSDTATNTTYEGFKWALPSAFAESLSKCRFEKGDVLYSSTAGYSLNEAVQNGIQCIQVQQPSRGFGRASDSAGVFEQNWRSEVAFKFFTVKDGKYEEVREVTTTQGKLFTFLWKGDWKAFDGEKDPEAPRTWFSVSRDCEKVAYPVKERFLEAAQMEKANIWIMAYDSTHELARMKYEAVKKRLMKEFSVTERIFSPEELGLHDFHVVPTLKYVCFAINLGASAKIADALKEVLYKPDPIKETDADRFRLSNHGFFIPYHFPSFEGDIITVSFAHGKGAKNLFYRYRLHKARARAVDAALKSYLTSVIMDCPNHFFCEPPFCSKLKLELPITLKRLRYHNLINMADESIRGGKYKSEHENVQMFLLKNDPETVAVEVPVWAEWEELGTNNRHVQPEGTLTGHIDLLRCNSKIEIWDYKPAAYQETCAASQVFFYTLMLSKRTGIPLERFSCGYFDPSDAYVFDPSVAAYSISEGKTP